MASVIEAPIPGAKPHYRARSDGRISGLKGRLLRVYLGKQGYPVAAIRMLSGETAHRPAHQWIMRAFVGPPLAGWQVNHRNGDRTDNRLENLEYLSSRDNNRDAGMRNGTLLWRGLTQEQYDEIVERLKKFGHEWGYALLLAREFRVSTTRIAHIRGEAGLPKRRGQARF